MTSDADTIRELRERIETLEEEIRQLRADMVQTDPTFLGVLSQHQMLMLRGIMSRPVADYAYLDRLTEDRDKYNRHSDNDHTVLRGKVAVWKLRKKLKPFGVIIKTWRGIGYYLDEENKAKLKQLMEKKDD